MAEGIQSVAGLTAAGGQGQIVLRATMAPAGNCLPYLELAVLEWWAATGNNRGSATKIGESVDISFVHTGLAPTFDANGNPAAVSRWYWVRPRDASGNLGDFFPAGVTAGIKGTTDVSAEQAVTSGYNAKITSDRNTYYGPGGSLAAAVTKAQATADDGTAAGKVRIRARTGSDVPSGYDVSMSFEGRVTTDDGYARGGFYLDGNASGFRWRLVGSQGVIETDDGTRIALFTGDGKLKVGRLEAESIDSPDLVKQNVFTDIESYANDDPKTSSTSDGVFVEMAKTSAISVPDGKTTGVEIDFSSHVFCGSADVHIDYRIMRNGSELHRYNGGHVFNGGSNNAKRFPLPFKYFDTPGKGSYSYSVEALSRDYSGNEIATDFYQRRLTAKLFKR